MSHICTHMHTYILTTMVHTSGSVYMRGSPTLAALLEWKDFDGKTPLALACSLPGKLMYVCTYVCMVCIYLCMD